MVMLPTGQVLFTDFSTVAIYTPTGAPNPAWSPSITFSPSNMTRGASYTISGKQFNGVSQGCYYGDDFASATNYPIVRFTNQNTGHVFYARSYGFSYMGVQSSRPVSTQVDVPLQMETGKALMEVVANGIASPMVTVTIQ